ncbi:DegT/DnrJ/EryC1/StrS family aminotransferase [Alphaproteobacteria bacterium]|nr:DegT/DnrJ/EryC1/StrS family aminotransferase [Alphaproteobacteria bacterium]
MVLSVPHSRPWIEAEDRVAVDEVLKGGMIDCGVRVHAFERAVANCLGASGGIACTSGTAALCLALKTLGIGAGDEVVLPTYVCWDVLVAVIACGATPCLCDVDVSGVPTVKTVRAALSSKTRAIVAVHIFGHPCDIASLSQLGLPVIEDACQAFGLEINGRRAGTAGTLGILSFHATKCLTTGEGGMLVASQPDLLERARALSESAEGGNMVSISFMTDMQAALGLAQLKRYPAFLERRRQLFKAYNQVAGSLATARPGYGGEPLFLFRFTLRVQQGFDAVLLAMLANGVQVRRGVDELLHRRLGLDDHDFPNAAALFSETISIPFYPSLGEEEVAWVLCTMQKVFGDA